MKKLIIGQFLLFSLLISVHAQQKNESRKYIEIPSKYGAVFIMNQADSALKILEVQLLTDERGAYPQVRYLVKNNSAKQIISFSVEFQQKSNVRGWGRYGNGSVENIGKKEEKTVVIPYSGTYENIEKSKVKLIPITKEVSDLFNAEKGTPKIKTLWIGFIKKIVFEDGSEYQADISSDDLMELLLDEN